MSEDKIKKQSFIIEYDKLPDKKFNSRCTCCETQYVSPFDFKCILRDMCLDISVNNVVPVCKDCYSRSTNKPNVVVYKKVQELTYKKHYGIPRIKCFCCRDETITPFNYVGGHIIARVHGGKYVIDNIKPICNLCNGSMGVRNMYEFMKTYLCIDIIDDLSDKKLSDEPTIDLNNKPVSQQQIIDDAKANGMKSIYGNYVLIKSNNFSYARGKNIKERIAIIADKKWTLKELFTDKQYLKIEITDARSNKCNYELSKLKYDISHDYLKFVKP